MLYTVQPFRRWEEGGFYIVMRSLPRASTPMDMHLWLMYLDIVVRCEGEHDSHRGRAPEIMMLFKIYTIFRAGTAFPSVAQSSCKGGQYSVSIPSKHAIIKCRSISFLFI